MLISFAKSRKFDVYKIFYLVLITSQNEHKFHTLCIPPSGGMGGKVCYYSVLKFVELQMERLSFTY